MSGNPQRRRVYILWAVLFGAVILLGWSWQANTPVPEDQMLAYDDVSELKQIIEENFDETLADIKRRDGEQTAGVALSDATSTMNPPPGEIGVNAQAAPEFANKKYDDAEWHYDGDFPEDVPMENAYSHIGFYLTWAVEEDLISEFVKTQSSPLVLATRQRMASPIALLKYWDDKLVSDMLSEKGVAFSDAYYEDEKDGYLPDFMSEFSAEGDYRVTPSWKNYDRIKPVISRRYEEWKAESAKP